MNRLPVIAILLLVGLGGKAQTDNPKFDKALADSLGGDEYGMKMYVLVLLKTGSNQSAGKEKTDSLFRGHMENINRLVTSGKLVVAGPLVKNEKAYRGIFILNANTIEEASDILPKRPAVGKTLRMCRQKHLKAGTSTATRLLQRRSEWNTLCDLVFSGDQFKTVAH